MAPSRFRTKNQRKRDSRALAYQALNHIIDPEWKWNQITWVKGPSLPLRGEGDPREHPCGTSYCYAGTFAQLSGREFLYFRRSRSASRVEGETFEERLENLNRFRLTGFVVLPRGVPFRLISSRKGIGEGDVQLFRRVSDNQGGWLMVPYHGPVVKVADLVQWEMGLDEVDAMTMFDARAGLETIYDSLNRNYSKVANAT